MIGANLQGMLIAGGLSAAVAFGFGWKLHADGEAGRTAKAVATNEKAVKEAASKLIDAQIAEKNKYKIEADFAKGEVAKINDRLAAQLEEQKTLLLADRDSREAAAARTEKAAQKAAQEARDAAVRFQKALEALKNVADECAKAPVSSDARRLLDDILAGTAAGSSPR